MSVNPLYGKTSDALGGTDTLPVNATPAGDPTQIAGGGNPNAPYRPMDENTNRFDFSGVHGPNSGLQPHQAALLDNIALGLQQKSNQTNYWAAANQGMTTEQADQNAEEQRLQQQLAELSAKAAQETVNLDDTKFNEFQQHLTDTISNPTPLPHEAKLQNPNVWQGLAGLLGAAIDPRHAFQSGAAPFEAQLHQQQTDTAKNYNDYGLAEHARQSKIQGLNQLADNQAAHDQRMLQMHQHNAGLYQSEANRIQGRLWTMDTKKQANVVHLLDSYDRANTPTEKEYIAKQIARIDPLAAPSADMLRADKASLTMKNEHLASQEWHVAVQDELHQFGVIRPERKAEFDAQRAEIARHYGISPEALSPVPTGETLAKQAAAEKIKEFGQRFNALQDQRKAQLAQSQGRLDVSRQQLELAGQRYQLASQLGYGNMELARYRAEIEHYNAVAKENNSGVAGGIKDLDPQVQKALAKYNSLNGKNSGATKPQIAAAKAEYDGLVGQQSQLRQMQQPTIDLGIMMGGAQLPNADYKPKGGNPVPPVPQPKPQGGTRVYQGFQYSLGKDGKWHKGAKA